MNEPDFSKIDSLKKSVNRYSTTIVVIDIIMLLAAIALGFGIFLNIFLLHAIPFVVIILSIPIKTFVDWKLDQKRDLLRTETYKNIIETFEKIKEAKIR